jgi:hypothetical protein
VSSFVGLGQIDNLAANMERCEQSVKEIDQQKWELQFASPNDPTIHEMQKIIDACQGMNAKNIKEVKGRLAASGVITALGGIAGIAGGFTSMSAVSKEKDSNNKEDTSTLNNASNILSVGATAAGLVGTILSGVTLFGLIKNDETAARCKAAF